MRAFMSVLATAAVVAAACGGGGGAAAPSGAVTIKGTDYAFSPDTVRLKVGQEVRITFRNDGEKDHEMMIGKGVKMMDGKPDGYQTWFMQGMQMRFERDGKAIDAMGAMGGDMDEPSDIGMMLVDKGASPVTIVFTVPDKVGEWEMGCFEDNGTHYDQGMKGKVIVEK
ncbi:MAG: cupredoxin domain-containing protein [Elusimicrobia bacterium]|nr:cupredoxin domain-containing protein [Elusimicrobiota bacterium]